MIQPEQEMAMAKNIGAKITILQTSHVLQQSQPAKEAAVILEAVSNSK